MDGKALEAALALWQLPSMRATLRQRPLPHGVGELIELAAGSPERVAQAADLADVSSEKVLEAARFYITEVLMYDGADAYRVLGVSRGDASGHIKANHRALLRWLHPDRHRDGWESVYAKRVNIAWGELRSPERSAAYDARNPVQPLPVESEQLSRRVMVNDWRAEPREQIQWHVWVVAGTVLVACIWLVVLADRQASAPPPEWIVASKPEPGPGTDETDAGAAVAPSVLAKAVLDRVAAAAARRAKFADAVASTQPPIMVTPAIKLEAGRVEPVAEAAEPPPSQVPKRIALVLPVAAVRIPAPSHVPAVVKAAVGPQPPAQSRAATIARPSISLVPTPAVRTPTPRPILAAKAPVKALARAQAPASARVPTQPPVQAPAQSMSMSAMASEGQLERVRLAHRRGGEVTRYLASSSSRTPPIWRSVATQDAAAALRERLDGGRTRVARVLGPARFGDPIWRIASDRATMTSTIERKGSKAGEGTLHVELAWREGMWLVDSIKGEDLP